MKRSCAFGVSSALVLAVCILNHSARADFEPFAASMPGLQHAAIAWGDYDNDGQLDVLIAGKPFNSADVVQLWRNTGSGFTNVPSIITGSPARATMAWGDFNRDGWMDFAAIGGISPLRRNTGGGFTFQSAPGMPSPSEGSVAWGDFDNDGRPDLLMTGGGNLQPLWRNTGGGFTPVNQTGLPRVYQSSAAWADFDNDGLLDVLITGTTNQATSGVIAQLWRNTGNGFVHVAIPDLPGVRFGSVAWGDYDNDGLLDFLITGSSATFVGLKNGISQLWRNTGNGFTNVPIPDLPQLIYSSVAWGDYDNDGWLDFLITGSEQPGLVTQLWRNTGSTFTNVPLPGVAQIDQGSAQWADFDNDGRLDFLVSGWHGTQPISQLWRSVVAAANAPPAAPAALRASVSGGIVTLEWDAPEDDHTPPDGLSYNVRIGTTPGGADIVTPPALAEGKLMVARMGNARRGAFYRLPPGQTFYWSVQAVDTGFAGSPFASEQQFTTGPMLVNPIRQPDGSLEFHFTNQSVLTFDVLASTNALLPVTAWTNLGPATVLENGLFQFADPDAAAEPQRFYLLREQVP
jgi:hypothetical protein